MDLAPSPAADPAPSIDDITTMIIVAALVILAVVGMLLMHVLGSLRRQSKHGLLHGIVLKVDLLSYPLVGFTIGKMDSSDWYFKDFAVWAVVLLLVLSSTVSLTACRLDYIDNWKGIYIKHLFQGFMVVLIVLEMRFLYHPKGMSHLWRPLTAILLVGVLKGYVRIASMRIVSRPYLCKYLKVVDEYMKSDDQLPPPFDPVTMQGYRYVVAGEKHCGVKQRHGCTPAGCTTTVEQIWQCKGNLLLQGRGNLLKDVCLSMALSKMLNRRFAEFNIFEAGREETHDFVFKGLLLAGDNPYQRAFRIIEEELAFVHDWYYTSYFYLYQKGRYLALCLPVIMFGLCFWLTVMLVKAKKQDDTTSFSVTIYMTALLAILEAWQLYLYIASGWFKVALIQSYVCTAFLQCCPFEIIIGLILRLKAFRPWKGTLGQYCLLGNLGRKSRFRNCLHYSTLRLVDKVKKRGRQSSAKLSEDVKKAIVDSLLGSNGHLTSGVTSLQNNDVHDLLSWACDDTATDGSVTHKIVVWHIATTLCLQELDEQAKKDNMVRTASTLSKYCLYLLAFAPDLLPDRSYISEPILDKAIDEADTLLKKHKKLDKRCRILKEYSGDDAPLLTEGAKLARHLMNDIQESTLRWKVLSDFWAEMMLYVSPSDDARAHLEVLAKGGEFITHLWALLTHAGVLKRGYIGQKDV